TRPLAVFQRVSSYSSLSFSLGRSRSRCCRAPDEQAPFTYGDEPIDQDHEDHQHQHPAEYAGDVEHALCLRDAIAETRGRTEILADDRADERKPDRRVK